MLDNSMLQVMYMAAAVLLGLIAGGGIGYYLRREKLGLVGQDGTKWQKAGWLLSLGFVSVCGAAMRTLDREQAVDPKTYPIAIGCMVFFAFVGFWVMRRRKG